MIKILKNKLFMTNLVADLISNFGDILYYIAMLNYVLLLENSELALSIITISETVPIFTGLFTGLMADKIHDKFRIVKLTLIFRMSIYILIGFIVKFEPALWIVIVVAILNFLSDITAQVENGLFIPIRMRMMEEDNRQEYLAFSQSASMATMVLFQILAGLLVAKMTFSNLAFFNAGTFAFALLIILSTSRAVSKLLEAKPLKINESQAKTTNFFAGMMDNLKDAINEFKKIGDMKLPLIIAPIVNGIGVAIPVLLTLIIKMNPLFVIKDAPFTLAIVETANLVGNVFGGMLIMSVFKEFDLNTTLVGATAGICGICFALYLQNSYLLVALMFLTGLLSGAINPKMSAMILNTVPEDKLATVGGGIGTYFQLGMMLMRFILSGLILIMTVKQISMLILIASVLITIYGIYEIVRGKNANNNR